MECIIAFFVNWHYVTFFYQSKQQVVLSAIRFFSNLIANMAAILINFQLKFALVRSFQHSAIKFLSQKNFSHA